MKTNPTSQSLSKPRLPEEECVSESLLKALYDALLAEEGPVHVGELHNGFVCLDGTFDLRRVILAVYREEAFDY